MFAKRSIPAFLAIFIALPFFCAAQSKPVSKPVSKGDDAPAKKEEGVGIGSVRAGKLSTVVIGVPLFDVKPGGGAGGIDPGFFQKVIYNDLEMFAPCKRAESQPLVEQANRRDKEAGRGNKDYADFAEWQRVGCNYVLKGEYSVDSNGRLEMECRLFDITTGERAFGQRYSPMLAALKRSMAHQMSDDVIKKAFNLPGIAGTQIVFVAQTSNPRVKELYLMDADGENLRQLSRDNSIAATPCWGMNGTEIYYTSYKDVNPDLWGIQIETRKTWVISRFAGLNYAPDWSPSNKRIALTLGKDGNSEIYTMDRNGNTATMKRLTHLPSIESSPCWSPAGNQLVFVSDQTGSPQIWMMDADGGNMKKISFHGSYNDAPVWAPTGTEIAYVSRDQGHFNIYTIRLDGSNLKQLTSDRNNEDPTYAPDGRHLVFSSNRTGNYEIFIMDNEGRNVRQLTRMGTNCQSPSWSPLFYAR